MAAPYSVSARQPSKPSRFTVPASDPSGPSFLRRRAVWILSAGVVVVGAACYLYRRRMASLRDEDDTLFQQVLAEPEGTSTSAQATTGIVHAGGDDARSRGLTIVETDLFVPDETRLQAIETLKTVIPKLGGKIPTKDAPKNEDTASSDDSYETDMDLEFSIANEMEKILRKKVISQSAALANPVVQGQSTQRSRKGRNKKVSTNPTLSLLETAKEYLEVSHERLKLKRKIAQRDLELALSRPFGGGKKNQNPGMVQQRSALGGRYGDLYDDEDEDGAENWFGDDDDDGPMMWGGDDDDDEYEDEEWEDEEEDWGEEEEEEEEFTDDEEAWLQALSGKSASGESYDEVERGEFERELIQRVAHLAAGHQSSEDNAADANRNEEDPLTDVTFAAPSAEAEDDDAWESESDNDPVDRQRSIKHQKKEHHRRGGRGVKRQQQGAWVDL